MRIAVVRERLPGELRVACVPETASPLIALGHQVLVEPGAGLGALITDDEYTAAGAEITEQPWTAAELVLSVQPLDDDRRRELAGRHRHAVLPAGDADAGRISSPVATGPDVLRDGLRAADLPGPVDGRAELAVDWSAAIAAPIVAAGRLRQFFPLSMTAAGTVKPAQVVVLGAGVAGLQAIATAKRLGAVVKGYDVRAAAAEEIASMGAVPIDLQLPHAGRRGRLRPGDVRRAGRPATRATAPLRGRRRRPDHHRRGPRSPGADAGHPGHGGGDAARLGGGRSGRRHRRQRRGRRARRGRPDRWGPGLGRLQRRRPRCPDRPAGCTPRTW